jgi:hypothetical protein
MEVPRLKQVKALLEMRRYVTCDISVQRAFDAAAAQVQHVRPSCGPHW